ncbi:TraQ conjugal transfer family protein [Chryseobacterium sp. 'Rf worker isolate 10']|uniref:TraQ conjugal transfer family protein n=1 Tax=Chryseobacterium sp. 'Rf worker isolate 10' TaxID=2887348 RepID=UPI003D6F0BCB
MKYFFSQQLLKGGVIKKQRLYVMFLFICLAIVSCSRELEVQTNFPFELEIMPVPSSVIPGEIVEIPCHIKREGFYQDTRYSIRYFQYEGLGSLMLQEDKPFKPNKLYKVPADSFKLHYRPKSKEGHKFQIWVADQFGNERTAEFDFN